MVESAPPEPRPGQPGPVEPRPSHPGPSQPGYVRARAPRELQIVLACYAMLFVLGIAEGVIGAFHYSGRLGPVPGAALGFAVLILVTCLLAAWGMYRPVAGLMPAVGWFAASFVLAMPTPGGSIVITNTTAGRWFLFGGAACAAAGVVASFTIWSAGRGSRPGELPSRKPGA